jgi:hypothetical protein
MVNFIKCLLPFRAEMLSLCVLIKNVKMEINETVVLPPV